MTAELAPGWPMANELRDGTASQIRQADRTRRAEFWHPSHYEVLSVPLPTIRQAELAGKETCGTCHETHVKAFAKNVPGEVDCEKCHGAASLHVGSQGGKAELILSFRGTDEGTKAGLLLSAAERSEVCLK